MFTEAAIGAAISWGVESVMNRLSRLPDAKVLAAVFDPEGKRFEGSDKIKVGKVPCPDDKGTESDNRWYYEVEPDCNDNRSERLRRCESLYGFSATPLSVDGAVITGGLDGRLFIFNSDSGELLFEYDTAVDFETTNGVEGYGGSIESHSIAAGSGMVFVGSGYGTFAQVPGNVLLAFKPSE